jgi:hypothetical protein
MEAALFLRAKFIVVLCAIVFHQSGSQGPAWASRGLKQSFWSKILDTCAVKRRHKEPHRFLILRATRPYTGNRRQAFSLHLCKQISMPTGGFFLIVKILDECMEIIWNSKNDTLYFLLEFYSQNSTVLWNTHLNKLRDLWKVRMLCKLINYALNS